MFEGLLVDLVPYSTRFTDREHEWLNGPGMFFWAMGGRWLPTEAQTRAMQQERIEDRAQGDLRVMFGIQTKDGTPIGLIGIRDLYPHNRWAMLTAFIARPEYWGGGYGTDALLLLVDYAFDWLDVRRVWLLTMAQNARAMRQMEKVGFALEGRQREATWVDGEWVDVLAYGLLRDEWPGREAMLHKLGLIATWQPP
jgi:RimJ/RimL family protein N-acetyltransferase